MVTVAGMEASAGLPLESVTTASPIGAGQSSETVPMLIPPPATVAGLTAILASFVRISSRDGRVGGWADRGLRD